MTLVTYAPVQSFSHLSHRPQSRFYHICILERKNNGWIGGSCGWNSTLVHRPEVRAQGLGSFSPVSTFLQAVKVRSKLALWLYAMSHMHTCMYTLYTVSVCTHMHAHVYTKASLKPIQPKVLVFCQLRGVGSDTAHPPPLAYLHDEMSSSFVNYVRG